MINSRNLIYTNILDLTKSKPQSGKASIVAENIKQP